MKTNHAGGILAGISTGQDILLRAYFKPTPSIGKPQKTINVNGAEQEIRIEGRHDPVIFPRALVVIEAMTALVLADALLAQAGARVEGLKSLFR